MKVEEARQIGEASLLRAKGIDDPRFEAEYLLRHATGLSRARLYVEWDSDLLEDEWISYAGLIDRRVGGKPSAYITGHREFYGLDFLADPRVMVPRPESELLVDLALQHIKDRGPGPDPCTIADVGTGSGALAIALAMHVPDARVYATDISSEALEVAAANCRRHAVGDRVTLLQGDLVGPLPCPVDVLVSNPPYVSKRDMALLPREIGDHEPLIALDGGSDGLDVIRRLLPVARGLLRPGGALFIEIGYDQGEGVLRTARGLYPEAVVGLQPDLSGIDRVLTVYLPRPVGQAKRGCEYQLHERW